MTLRTPRRRISPRTKRRYRAIREFFRRAIGSSSQPNIKINSNIALNITDLNRKIIGLEEQLDQVSKHCQHVIDIKTQPSELSDALISKSELNHDTGTIKEQTEVSTDRKTNGIETKVIYKTSGCNYGKCESDCELIHNDNHNVVSSKMNNEYNTYFKVNNKEIKHKLEKINEHSSKLRKHKTQSAYENFSTTYSTSSFHSLANPSNAQSHGDYSGKNNNRKHYKSPCRSPSPNQLKDKKRKDYTKRNKMKNYYTIYEDRPPRTRNHKYANRHDLDQSFIADIIRRQYKPVKMFGKRESDTSQFSAPICRDREFSIHENILEGSELCSCCYDEKKMKHRRNDLSDMRSICDTRLYSSKKCVRPSYHRVVDVYNNSEFYDLVPVKEKTSPKSRRKFVEDNLMPCEYYREVPPSPRTLRPRLNLKSQHYRQFDDYMVHVKPRCSPNLSARHQEYVENIESDITANVIKQKNERRARRAQKQPKVLEQQEQMQDIGTMSSLQYPAFANEQTYAVVDTSLNKTLETDVSVDKTDKALCEIKDILQSFLQEIKKEAQCDKSDSTSKTTENDENDVSIMQQNSAKDQSGVLPNSGHNFNNYSGRQCAVHTCVPPPFVNPCCYPIMCPMNCMQSSFVMPTPSFTCTNCANVSKESSGENSQSVGPKNTTKETFKTETEDLIKEIYKFVAQGSNRKHEGGSGSKKKGGDIKNLTSRSVGDSYKPSKHDAQVGTPKMKYSSKSCEAIRSNVVSDAYYNTNQSYSDTVLERLSLEVTQSDTEVSIASTEIEKHKESKFSRVLRSFGFLKKKKDVTEELSESESAIDVEVKPKAKPRSPFRQEMMNYMMYGQDYYNLPPSMQYQHLHPPTEYYPGYHQPYNIGTPEYSPPIQDPYINKYQQPIPEHSRSPYSLPQRPTAPPYIPHDNRYTPQMPTVPLCLKEIEVKSIATQSERKMSLFRKIQKKMQPPQISDDPQRNFGTQTAGDSKPTWLKNLQAKAMQDNNDPMKFSMKTQKQLAEGDIKMRNAMLKKLFFKRNPFSPRNLIMRTLLGKDKSSYGEPPMMFRPKMFL